jgi:two-component system LytT family response regulator
MVTAHAEHAIQAFDIEAVDYLLKPVTPARFAQAVQRLQAACAQGPAPNPEPTFSSQDHICLRTPQRTITVPVRDLLVLQAEGDFTRIYLKNSPPLMICAPIGQYEKLLPSPPFARLDRSLIINLQAPLHLRRKSRDEASLIIDKTNQEMPLGRTAQQRLRDALKQSGNNATMQL